MTATDRAAPAPPGRPPAPPPRHPVRTVVVVALLAVATGVVGALLSRSGIDLVGGVLVRGRFEVGTNGWIVVVLAIAVLVVVLGPAAAARLRWSALLAAASLTAAGWAVASAATKGNAQNGGDGIAGPLQSRHEYLHDVPRVDGLWSLLREYVAHVPAGSADPWTTHVAGHPPGPLAFFAALESVGLGGAGWAAAACIVSGVLAVPAVLVAVRALHGESAARVLAPYLTLAPWLLWVATSADALWLGTSAWGVALLCLAVTGRRPAAYGVAAGLLLGLSLFGSYGMALLAVVVLVLLARRWTVLPWVATGAVLPAAVALAGGFAWWEGLAATTDRVLAGHGAQSRPFAYFVVANLAVAAIALGPAVVAAVVSRGVRFLPLVWSALAVIVLADLTGLSKGEVERIWLPFYPWVTVAVLLLSREPSAQRIALAGQAGTTVLVQVGMLTAW